MFQIWEDSVEDYALVDAGRGRYTWIAVRDEDEDYQFLEERERSYYAVVDSPLLNKTGAGAPDLVFTGTEDECISFVKTLAFIRS